MKTEGSIITPSIREVLEKGVMSPKLREAIIATVDALDKGDLSLAYQLSSCKSYITGEIDPKDKKHAFQEDHKANVKTFGQSIYSIMDTLHHQIALKVGRIPSGMLLMSKEGLTKMIPSGTHPIVRRLIKEYRVIMLSGITYE